VIVDIRAAGVDRAPILASLCGRAFFEDPMLRWPLPADDDAPIDSTTKCFEAVLHAYAGAGLLFEAGDAAGMAVWVPPDRLSVFEAMDALSRSAIRPLTDDGGARYDRFWDWLGAHATAEAVWFLDIVAVDEPYRGSGIGTALVRFGLEQARATGAAAFLETSNPRNVPYYERLGFHVTEDADAPEGGPHIWFMRFEP